MLTAGDIRVSLGGRPVLHGIGMKARAGALTAIVGPNGSGKTTLLRALTGEIAAAGRIELNGRAIATLKPWELAAMRAVLPQASPLAFPFTAVEVVSLGLQSPAGPDRARAIHVALHEVGLAGKAEARYQELSGGEQQRVQLARVLAQVSGPRVIDGPRWLFLDEPVSSLDIRHQVQVMRIARRFAGNGGGVVAVMHDLSLTAAFADEVVLMKEGRVAAAGPVAEVLRADLLGMVYDCPIRVVEGPGRGLLIAPDLDRERADSLD